LINILIIRIVVIFIFIIIIIINDFVFIIIILIVFNFIIVIVIGFAVIENRLDEEMCERLNKIKSIYLVLFDGPPSKF
jgi:hypothetical protein